MLLLRYLLVGVSQNFLVITELFFFAKIAKTICQQIFANKIAPEHISPTLQKCQNNVSTQKATYLGTLQTEWLEPLGFLTGISGFLLLVSTAGHFPKRPEISSWNFGWLHMSGCTVSYNGTNSNRTRDTLKCKEIMRLEINLICSA